MEGVDRDIRNDETERLARLGAAMPTDPERATRIRDLAADIAPALAASPLTLDDIYDDEGLPA